MSKSNVLSFENSNAVACYKPSEQLMKDSELLHNLSSIKEKLQYYNDNICSLSYFHYAGQFYEFGNYGDFSTGLGSLFLTIEPGSVEYQNFLDIRQHEIERLKTLIESKSNYSEHLKVLFEQRAGRIRFDNEHLKVLTNDFLTFCYNGGGIMPDELKECYIDLRPANNEERKAYNEYLYSYYLKAANGTDLCPPIIKDYEYNGFKYTAAYTVFSANLQSAIDKKKSLSNEIKRVEQQFYSNESYVDNLYRNFVNYNSEQWQAAYFNSLLNGAQYDFSRIKLEPKQVTDMIHVNEIFEYYKLLLHIQKIENLNLSDFGKFLQHYKQEVEYLTFQDSMSKIVEKQKAKLEFSTLQSEVDEVKEHAEKSIKFFKVRLHSIFLNEVYKTRVIGSLPSFYNEVKALVEYENIYRIASEKNQQEKINPAEPQQNDMKFSVLEWATIFYYADETKLLSGGRVKTKRMEEFINKHNLTSTFDSFRNSYYEACNRINNLNNFPIAKLDLIMPFLEEYYKPTITKVENDIIFLEENKSDY